MEKQRAPLQNPGGRYFVSHLGMPYKGKTVAGLVEEVIREKGLNRQFSVKQFRKIGAIRQSIPIGEGSHRRFPNLIIELLTQKRDGFDRCRRHHTPAQLKVWTTLTWQAK